MQRLAIASLVLAACGTSDDERPRNLDYITEAILAPSCGAAQCHSSFKQADGLVFDTIDGARTTFQSDDQLFGTGETPTLIFNLTLEQVGKPRMPIEAPIPDVDIQLIKEWMQAGAPGVCVGARSCLGSYVVSCVDVTTHMNPTVTEKGAYKLDELNPNNDCKGKGMRCVNGACQ